MKNNTFPILLICVLGFFAFETEINDSLSYTKNFLSGGNEEGIDPSVELVEPEDDLLEKVAVISTKLNGNTEASKRLASLFYNKSIADFSGINTVVALRAYHRKLTSMMRSNKALEESGIVDDVDEILMSSIKSKNGWLTDSDIESYKKACEAIAWACSQASGATLFGFEIKTDAQLEQEIGELKAPEFGCILEPIQEDEGLMFYAPAPEKGLQFDPEEHTEFLMNTPRFRDVFKSRASTMPATRLLYRATYQLDAAAYSSEAQKTGDCTSHSCRWAGDTSRAVEIIVGKEPDQWEARGATEPIYGCRQSPMQGMTIARAAKFINELGGFPLRKSYCGGKYDFSTYNWRVGHNWGRTGVPVDLKKELSENRMQQATVCQTPEEIAKAIRSGYGVFFGSDIAFKKERDENGFLQRSSGVWYHAMCYVAVSTAKDLGGDNWKKYGPSPDSPCFGLNNSWGETYFQGPIGKYKDFPKSGGWVSYYDAKYMVKQMQTVAVGEFNADPISITSLEPEFASCDWLVQEGVFDPATFGMEWIATSLAEVAYADDITIPEGCKFINDDEQEEEEEIDPEPTPEPPVKIKMVEWKEIVPTAKKTGLPVLVIIGGDG